MAVGAERRGPQTRSVLKVREQQTRRGGEYQGEFFGFKETCFPPSEEESLGLFSFAFFFQLLRVNRLANGLKLKE